MTLDRATRASAFELALLEQSTGDFAAAISLYGRALALNPRRPLQTTLRGFLRRRPTRAGENWGRGHEDRRRVTRCALGDRPDVLDTLAAAYAEAGGRSTTR
jgi:hypothetical protein